MKHLFRSLGVAGLAASLAVLGLPGQASSQGELPDDLEFIDLGMSISPEEVELGSTDPITVTSVDPCPEAEPAYDSMTWSLFALNGDQETPEEYGDVPLNEDGSWSLTLTVPDAADVYYVTVFCISSAWTELPKTIHYAEDTFTVVDPADPAPPTDPQPPAGPPKLPELPIGPQPAPPVPGDPGFTG